MSWWADHVAPGEWSPGPYRWRTSLRKALPWRPPLYQFVPKGRDCGEGRHDWYVSDDEWEACYHCRRSRRRS